MRRILWFRDDLRVEDNPLLSCDGEVLPIFIFDPSRYESLPSTSKRLPFLIDRVLACQQALREIGLDLYLFYDDPLAVFERLVPLGFDEVCALEHYDTYTKDLDTHVSLHLPFHRLRGNYLFTPEEILKNDGTPYLVFTPYYHKALARLETKSLPTCTLGKMRLIDTPPQPLHVNLLTPSNRSFNPLKKTLDDFENHSDAYEMMRDFPAAQGTSQLSPYLSHGLLSIRTLYEWLQNQKKLTAPFLRQLLFREFYASMLYHFPYLETQNYKGTFTGIPDETKHQRFITATTGIPIIDAGIQELLQKGTMHNRIRMLCASFYTKHLLLPWQWGEAFFAQYLLDYDKASNVLSWQWSAGTGIDPQPFFRIFNPYAQSAKFDKEATYIKTFLPALKEISPKNLHDEAFLLKTHIAHYPRPMCLHKTARDQALAYMNKQKVPTNLC